MLASKESMIRLPILWCCERQCERMAKELVITGWKTLSCGQEEHLAF